jgi:hypothetical protein
MEARWLQLGRRWARFGLLLCVSMSAGRSRSYPTFTGGKLHCSSSSGSSST